MTIEEAIKEIERVKGTQLDEKLCNEFLELINKNMDAIQNIIVR